MLVSSQIVYLACTEAKGPGMLKLGGQYLNLVLQDLVINRDLKVNRFTQILSVTAGTFGPFNLEANYRRTYDLFYQLPAAGGATSSSVPIFLTPITMEQFDAEFKSSSISNYPYEFATDLSTQAITASGTTGQIYIYPQTSGTLNLTHRFMVTQPDIPTPEASSVVPWFEFQDYLIVALAARMMGVTGDNRRDAYFARAEEMLRPYLIMEGDEQQTVRHVRLDPRHFHFNRGLKPTKAMPF